MPKQEFFEEPEEFGEPAGDPGEQGRVTALLEALRKEVRALDEKVSSTFEARTHVEGTLEDEALQRFVRGANADKLEELIEKTPGLAGSVGKALRSTLQRMRSEGENDDEGSPSEGEQAMALHGRAQEIRKDLKALSGDDRGLLASWGMTAEEKAEERKLTVLLGEELKKVTEELSGLLSAVPDTDIKSDRWGDPITSE